MGDVSKPKEIPFAPIQKELEGELSTPYWMLESLVQEHHHRLVSANIQLFWRYNWKADRDGRLKIGEARLCSDPDRLLHKKDFVISLNHKSWQMMDESQRMAVIDHELTHCQVDLEQDGETVKVDSVGRIVYRIRGHDVEEFGEVVSRNGLYLPALESFAATCKSSDEKSTLDINVLSKGGLSMKVG